MSGAGATTLKPVQMLGPERKTEEEEEENQDLWIACRTGPSKAEPVSARDWLHRKSRMKRTPDWTQSKLCCRGHNQHSTNRSREQNGWAKTILLMEWFQKGC